MSPVREELRQAYSRVLGRVFRGNRQLQIAISLLAEPDADPFDVSLDSQAARTHQFVSAIEKALDRLGPEGRFMLQAASDLDEDFVTVPRNLPIAEMLVDVVARWLLKTLKNWPDRANRLAVATGRLIEECKQLDPARRREEPLGVGFDEALERRLRLRFGLIKAEQELLTALDRHEVMALEDPVAGRKMIEAEVRRKLSRKERDWLDAERFARMLEWSRSGVRKYFEMQIRWYLRRDTTDGVVLDRYGARGHWLVVGNGGPGALSQAGVLVARATDEERPQDPQAWRALIVGTAAAQSGGSSVAPIVEAHVLPSDHGGIDLDAASLTVGAVADRLTPADPERAGHEVARTAVAATPPPTLFPVPAPTAPSARQTRRRYELTVRGHELQLGSVGGPADRRPLAQVALDPDDETLLEFQDVLGRAAQAAPIIERIGHRHAATPAVRWARALLARPAPPPSPVPDDLTDLKIRLVYIPASLEHPLGGLPTIGLRYLADHLERLGARVDVMTLSASDLERRRVELLGADVIGLSVYLTNDKRVAREVKRLRKAGFTGKIVLGGPHLRDIDTIQNEVTGWDALIRGEGEEVFPQIIRVLRRFDAGEAERALALARSLRGVTIAADDLVVLADTAARNAVTKVSPPLPFEWKRHNDPTTLKMNFTRGCPYACGFCPNHQGRHPHSCDPNEIWSFTQRAAADALRLPPAAEKRITKTIQVRLGVQGAPRLRPALQLLLRDPVPRELLEKICDGPEPTAGDHVPRWRAKQRWLAFKATWVEGARLRDRADRSARDPERAELQRFEIMTSEDNTLANEKTIKAFLRLRSLDGLADAVTFDPGQNTVRDLTNHKGALNLEYVDALCERNPFKVVLGVDGTSNAVLRQNQKPMYTIGEAVALNRALAERGVEVLNNYILINPETNLLEAIESFALFVLLPITWRDHGQSINLRITKEPGTRSHDEGLLFVQEPGRKEYNDPLRYPEVDALLADWKLTSNVHSDELPDLLWRLLAEDPAARRLLPQVVERWQRDFDHDPFLVDLARRITAVAKQTEPLVAAFRQVAGEYAAAWPTEPLEIAQTPSRPQDTAPAEEDAHPQRPSRRDRPSIPTGTRVRPRKKSGARPGSS